MFVKLPNINHQLPYFFTKHIKLFLKINSQNIYTTYLQLTQLNNLYRSSFRKLNIVETDLSAGSHLGSFLERRHRVGLEQSRLVYHAQTTAATIRVIRIRVYIN